MGIWGRDRLTPAAAPEIEVPEHLLEDDEGDDPRRGLIDAWEDRRPTEEYLRLFEMAASWDRMGLLGKRVPETVLDQLPARLPDREAIAQIRKAEGFIAHACPDSGDGDPHDPPKWRPYLPSGPGSRWCPMKRATHRPA